jgi:D-alanyl-D-alanine dipeptidase
MNSSRLARAATFAALLTTAACASGAQATSTAQRTSAAAPVPQPDRASASARSPVSNARQLLVVTTPAWDSTSGTLRRYVRSANGANGATWRQVGAEVPIVVGRTGLAWDDALGLARPGEPVKREGDGRSPAGAFALDTAFGFNQRPIVPWVRLPYLQLRESTECVDDANSQFYNTIVDRERVTRVDWKSAERMREIEQYSLGVHVAYNSGPQKRGRGSCIFLHIWGGPGSVTAGCTAMDAAALERIVRWLDPAEKPMIVQLPVSALASIRTEWGLP